MKLLPQPWRTCKTEAEIVSLKERNEILRNYVASLEETNERVHGENLHLKELLTERKDSAELFKMRGRKKLRRS